MDLNAHRGKLAVAGLAALVAIGGLGGAVMGGLFTDGPSPGNTVTVASVPVSNAAAPALTADHVAAAIEKCDTLASDPYDPNRAAKPVPDTDFAPALAIAACEEALALDPDNARVKFELGRAYWLAHRDGEAFLMFADSADQEYAAAMKFIGDAFYLGRGLPSGESANAPTALEWYRKAQAGGYDAQEVIEVAETAIRRNTFDESRFQNGPFMRLIYEGRLEEVDNPMAMAFYLQGIVSRLDDEQTVFMDEKCKPLLNIIGNFVIQNGHLFAIARAIAQNRKANNGRPLVIAGLSFLAGSVFKDQGNRDGIILWDEDIYGCDSAVTKQIVSNFMVKIQQGT